MTAETAPSTSTTAAAGTTAPATTTTTAPAATVDWQAKAAESEKALASAKADTSKAIQEATAKAVQEVEGRFKAALSTPEGLSKVLASLAPAAADPVKEASELRAALVAKDAANEKLRTEASRFARKTQVQNALLAVPGFIPAAAADAADLADFSGLELGEDFSIKDAAGLKAKAEALKAAKPWFFSAPAPAVTQQNSGTPFPRIATPPAPAVGGDAPGGTPVNGFQSFAAGFNAPPDQRPKRAQ